MVVKVKNVGEFVVDIEVLISGCVEIIKGL
jgi:hypothetical protein